MQIPTKKCRPQSLILTWCGLYICLRIDNHAGLYEYFTSNYIPDDVPYFSITNIIAGKICFTTRNEPVYMTCKMIFINAYVGDTKMLKIQVPP